MAVTNTGDVDTQEDERGRQLSTSPRLRSNKGANGQTQSPTAAGAGSPGAAPGAHGAEGNAAGGLAGGAKAPGAAGGLAGGAGGAASPHAALAKHMSNALGRSQANRQPTSYALIGILICGLLAGGFFALLPLKLESLLDNIIERRVENELKSDISKRMSNKQLMQEFFKSSLGASDAQFADGISGLDDATQDLLKTWRKGQLGESIEDEEDVSVVKNDDGSFNVLKDGELVGTLDSGTGEALAVQATMNASEAMTFMERGPIGYLGVKMFNWPGKVFDNQEDPAKAQAEVEGAEIDDAQEVDAAAAVEVVECATEEGDCDAENAANPQDVDEANSPVPTTQTAQSNGEATQSSSEQASPDVQNAEQEVEEAAESGTLTAGAAVKKALSALNYVNPNFYVQKLVSRLLTKFLAPAISSLITQIVDKIDGPLALLGILDLVAHIDHFLWTGEADKLLVALHKIEYGAQFFLWMTMRDQIRSGQNVSGAERNVVNEQLSGGENSAAEVNIYDLGTGGQSLDTTNDGSSNATSRSVDEHVHPIAEEYQNSILPSLACSDLDPTTVESLAINGPSAACRVIADTDHQILNVVYYILGPIFHIIQTLIGLPTTLTIDILKHTPGFSQGYAWAEKHASSFLIGMVMKIVIPAVEGTEVGPDLVNGIDAGATEVGIASRDFIGGAPLTDAQAQQVSQQVGLYDEQQAQQQSLATRLFSTSYPESAINLLALRIPSTPQGAFDDGVNYMASIMARPYEAILPSVKLLVLGNASADDLANATPADNYGMIDYGFTDQMLGENDTPQINEAFANAQTRLGLKTLPDISQVQLSDCPPPASPTDADMCRFDIAMFRSLGSSYSTSNDGGPTSSW